MLTCDVAELIEGDLEQLTAFIEPEDVEDSGDCQMTWLIR
jgi:hypothetical protein